MYDIDRAIEAEPVLRFFQEDAQPLLPDAAAAAFRDAALEIVHHCARTPERTIALRALITAQDEASRAWRSSPR